MKGYSPHKIPVEQDDALGHQSCFVGVMLLFTLFHPAAHTLSHTHRLTHTPVLTDMASYFYLF